MYTQESLLFILFLNIQYFGLRRMSQDKQLLELFMPVFLLHTPGRQTCTFSSHSSKHTCKLRLNVRKLQHQYQILEDTSLFQSKVGCLINWSEIGSLVQMTRIFACLLEISTHITKAVLTNFHRLFLHTQRVTCCRSHMLIARAVKKIMTWRHQCAAKVIKIGNYSPFS